MSRFKTTIKQISEKEMFDGMSKKRIAILKRDLANIKFASKHKIEVFSGTYSHVPIPVHLLGKKLSKHDESVIAGLVALVANDIHGRFAKTIQYIHKRPKNDPHVKMILKNSKYVAKRGVKDKELLAKLFARKNKLKKHELFGLWLGV